MTKGPTSGETMAKSQFQMLNALPAKYSWLSAVNNVGLDRENFHTRINPCSPAILMKSIFDTSCIRYRTCRYFDDERTSADF